MPELPEVETIGRQLRRLVVGQTISSIEVFNPDSFRADPDSLIGKTIIGVGRKGKVLFFRFDPENQKRSFLARQGDSLSDNKRALFIHLKMSGQLGYKVKGRRKREEGKAKTHLRVVINFVDQSRLEFCDQRKFGWITDDPAALPPGIDALDPALSSNKLAEILGSSSRPIKQILLDQSKIAGLGNIYASEILWYAKTNPATKGLTFCARKGVSLPKQGDSLSEISEKFRKLLTAIREVLTEAIESGGSTMDDGLYRHVGGESGSYWSRRRIYDREGEPCRRPACRQKGAVIQKIAIARRSTYWCPNCQAA